MLVRVTTIVAAWLLGAIFTPVLTAQPAAAGSDAAYLIVTRPDVRRCAYPLCGGYFVKQVNQNKTRCADGVLRSECHVADVDFATSGLDAETADKFETALFATGHGLVRGELEQRDVGAAVLADTLDVAEAWAGQALTTPSGTFFRLTSTGIVCITFPCPSYLGERLNAQAQRNFNRVDLTTSGASQKAIDLGNAELSESGILAAGSAVEIRGPGGVGYNFAAREFYLRVKSAGDRCAAQDATGLGPCDQFFGYAWDGAACVGISGCSCEGADCSSLVSSLEECQKAHAGCSGALCGSRGLAPCADDAYCDFLPEAQCGTFDAPGVCVPRPELCTTIYSPVCGCDGVTYSSACQAHGAGIDDASAGPCSP